MGGARMSQPMHHTITLLADTWAKASAAQSSTLPDSDKAMARAGEWPIRGYREEGDHIVITLDPDRLDLKTLHPSGRNTWWFYKGHIEDPAGFGPNNQPADQAPAAARGKGHPFTLPGQASTFYSGDPIIPGGNFTWAEALHFNGARYRPPANPQVVSRLLVSARAMQEVRDRLGKPVLINSWYRDPATNRAVNGATQSRHIAGDGVDFRVPGMRHSDVFAALDGWWGNRGGLASSSVFTHIDLRRFRARWSYGF